MLRHPELDSGPHHSFARCQTLKLKYPIPIWGNPIQDAFEISQYRFEALKQNFEASHYYT